MRRHLILFTMTAPTLSETAQKVLLTANPSIKTSLTNLAHQNFSQTQQIGTALQPPSTPARPPLPKIVPITQMPTPKTCDLPSNIFYLHTIAHVELNAIDLCFDNFLRFPHPSLEWAHDWLSIAVDEARHYTLLSNRLQELGFAYGDMPAHDQIWQSATASQHCVTTRLALGQLVAEARGLDAGPRLSERLVGLGDNKSAAIVKIIAEEEVRHVEIGVKWFVKFCESVGKDPLQEFRRVALDMANPSAFVPPFNRQRREEAGLLEDWYLPVAEEMKRLRERRRLEKS